MSNFKNQNGNAHVIIIIIVSTIIVGALGFIYWNNFVTTKSDSITKSEITKTESSDNQKNDTASTAVSPSGTATNLVGMEIMTSDSFGIRYKMPSTWSGGKYGGGDNISDSESTTIKAPDGFSIYISISRLIRGWEPDSQTAKVLEVQPNAKAGLNWAVVDRYNTSGSSISLQIFNSKERALKVGDDKLQASSIYKLGEAEGSGVYLEMYGGYTSNMSLDTFNAKESVKQAKAIFESVSIGV